MATTTSPPTPLGSPLPDAMLEDLEGVAHRLADLLGEGPTLVAFVCNHCPYVQHIEAALGAMADEYGARGVDFIAVVSNDPVGYPQDGPDGMREQIARAGWRFPYLRDRDHAFALAVGAVCTPDLFLYDADRRLAHRGAFDASTPRNDEPLTGADLRSALDAVLGRTPVPDGLTPSLGCGIKWAEGHAPE
jgi:thiol-disulfide isomerase/thioredoxin